MEVWLWVRTAAGPTECPVEKAYGVGWSEFLAHPVDYQPWVMVECDFRDTCFSV